MNNLKEKVNNLATEDCKNTFGNNWESAVINICDFVTSVQKIGLTENKAIKKALEITKELVNDKNKES